MIEDYDYTEDQDRTPTWDEYVERVWSEALPSHPLLDAWMRSSGCTGAVPPQLRYTEDPGLCRDGHAGILCRLADLDGAVHALWRLPLDGDGNVAPDARQSMRLHEHFDCPEKAVAGAAVAIGEPGPATAVCTDLADAVFLAERSGCTVFMVSGYDALRAETIPASVRRVSLYLMSDRDYEERELALRVARQLAQRGRLVRLGLRDREAGEIEFLPVFVAETSAARRL